MKKNLLLFVVLLLIGIGLKAQPDLKHSIYFKDKKCVGNVNGMHYWTIEPHSSGSFYATKILNTGIGSEPLDVIVYKLNAQFDTVWRKQLGGSRDDLVEIIRELPNHNILLAGYTGSKDGDVWYGHNYSAREIWIVEIDTNGTVVKGKTFGGGNGSNIWDAVISSNGDIYLCGQTFADDYDFAHVNIGGLDANAWMAIVDTSFALKHVRVFVGNTDEAAFCLAEVKPNKIVVSFGTGGTDSEMLGSQAKGMGDAVIYCVDTNLTTVWAKRYGSSMSDEIYKCKIDTMNNSIYFLGLSALSDQDISYQTTDSFDNSWILILDTLGNIKHSKAYGVGPYSGIMYMRDAIWYNNHFWIMAQENGFGGDVDGQIGVNNNYNSWVGMIDSHANLVAKYTIRTEGTDYPVNFFKSDGNLYLNGYSASYNNPLSCDTNTFVNYIFNIGIAPLGIDEIQDNKANLFILSPNPAHSTFNIQIQEPYPTKGMTLQVKSMDGRMVYHAAIDSKATINCSDWHSGLYTISIFSEDGKSQTQLFRKE